MRLQRLEITGFKSFSDRSELSFDRGVTAIVGPNGCGKSNVADAIVWVLGEQSAKSLRGDRMEDVIFSGSDARKPNAAAEVRLMLAGVPALQPGPGAAGALADDEGRPMVREVEVTRRLYRSGESEYLINGEASRLRDVHELLMDTGLGAKAYAVIEQGKIGQILSSKPVERRQLIEEAAGVTKYRARRRTAELKLEAARQNLTRIDDIIFEVEKQRGTLMRQAAKARRYGRLRDELRRWEKVLVARRQRVLAQAIAGADTRIAQARAAEAGAAARLAEREAAVERVRLEAAGREQAAREARETAHVHEVDIGRLEARMQADEARLASLAARAADLEREIAALAGRREPAAADRAAKAQAAARAGEERDDAAAALAAAQEVQAALHATMDGLEGDVEAVRAEQFAAASAVTALQHAVQNALATRERVARDLARWTGEAGDLDIEEDRARRDRQAASEALASAKATLEAVARGRAARDAELSALRAERDLAASALREREQELADASARLRSLEEFEAARSAYEDGARLLLAAPGGPVAHAGSLADHLDVAPGYERAVEACLGDVLQYVVVPSHDEAARALGIVKAHGAGRCGFVITGSRPGGPGAEAIDEAPPAPGLVPLASVASLAGPHADALAPLVRRAWIADSYADAVAAAALTADPVATLDGEVCLGPRLVLGGGRRDGGRGILQTKRDTRELRERLAADRSAVSALADTVAGLEHRLTLGAAALDAMRAEIHRVEMAMVGSELRVAQADDELARIRQKRDLVGLDVRRAQEEAAALDAREAEARAAIARLAGDQRAIDERLDAAQRTLFEAREGARQKGDGVRDAMARHARLVERATMAALEAARADEAAREIESRLAARQDERRQAGEDQEGLRQSVREAGLAFDDAVGALGAARDAVGALDQAVAELRALEGETEADVREARRALDEARAARSEIEVARARAESDLEHLEAACADTLGCGLASVIADVEQMERDGDVSPDWRTIFAEEPDEEPAPADAAGGAPAAGPAAGETAPAADAASSPRAEPADAPTRPITPEEAIGALKRKIEKLGPVNMMAIEEYDQLDARHGFLTGQRRDLVESIASTGEAIKKIDHTTRERFREAFDAINLQFQQVFATLFGGGRAGLTLVDEDDILESGIEIIAQPPGKRLQNVQLLSGGEKALAAISLMFAIFRHKPSPFCLLDEIDAPLDDANTGRFLDMLRELQDETQFILITHNRKTMEVADRLYGVTMEEPGVSKLISVRLN
ncbi:MAG TPA: chromosome segregation protein SMC [Vicinamibacterales bacterium]|nr:chromosome segregation protein SMC [Vicinamibacterales bacterium]